MEIIYCFAHAKHTYTHICTKNDLNMTCNNINSSLLQRERKKKQHTGHKTITAHKHLGIMLQLNRTEVR